MAGKRALGTEISIKTGTVPTTWPYSEPLNVTRALRDISLMRPVASVLRIYSRIRQNSYLTIAVLVGNKRA